MQSQHREGMKMVKHESSSATYEETSIKLLEQIAADLRWLRKHAERLDRERKADRAADEYYQK
jgi:hypothetical protein